MEILVRKRKFDGRVKSEWQGKRLPAPSDDWLVVRHHPERHLKFSNGVVQRADLLFTHCFNVVRPITVLLGYAPDGRFSGAKADAALPATRQENVIEFVDLDLDLVINPDCSSYVQDEESFAQNRQLMGYPTMVVQQAYSGIKLAQALFVARQFPFDGLPDEYDAGPVQGNYKDHPYRGE